MKIDLPQNAIAIILTNKGVQMEVNTIVSPFECIDKPELAHLVIAIGIARLIADMDDQLGQMAAEKAIEVLMMSQSNQSAMPLWGSHIEGKC